MKLFTCTWAPTVFEGPKLVGGGRRTGSAGPRGSELTALIAGTVRKLEDLGLSHLLIAQRWWGSGEDMEGSSLDCLAMTAMIAAHARTLTLITAIHPGFFEPTAIAKWGATLDAITDGCWAINVTSGWNLREFDMYGIDALEHGARYARASEFIEVLRGAWGTSPFAHAGPFYRADGLALEPRPARMPAIYQGGQSDAAIEMAAAQSDWMFLNGGTPQRIGAVIDKVRAACRRSGRTVRFAMYAAPLCRPTDAQAWAVIDERLARIDAALAARRRQSVGGAQGMWSGEDPLSLLDTNEGYAARLIGSPDTIHARLAEYHALGIDMLHFDASDALFNEAVLPAIRA